MYKKMPDALKKLSFSLFLIVTFFICSASFSIAGSEKYVSKRGVGDYPYAFNDANAYIDAFKKAREAGGVIMHHVQLHWCKLKNESFEAAFPEYKYFPYLVNAHHLESMLVIDVTDGGNRCDIIGLPTEFQNATFGNQDIRSAYLDEIMWLADNFNPRYMALAVEIEGYYVGHPNDFSNFVSLYKEAYEKIKLTHPNTRVFVYFQYEGLQGLWRSVFPKSELSLENLWFLIDEFSSYLDAAAFSSYPEVFYQDPAAIPADYYKKITEHTSLPIIFAELGWSSRFGPDGKATNTAAEQVQFIKKFFNLTKTLKPELTVWYFLHDMEGEDLFANISPWWKTMGLRDTNGKPKPSWYMWKSNIKK